MRRTTALTLSVASLALALTACGGSDDSSGDGGGSGDSTTAANPEKPIEAAIADCGVKALGWAPGDGGSSVTLEGSSALAYKKAFCVLNALDVTDAVTGQINTTTMAVGQQEADWETGEGVPINAKWSYGGTTGGLVMILVDES